MRFNHNNRVWLLRFMINKYNTKYHSGFKFGIWQQEDSDSIQIITIEIWKFYCMLFLARMPVKYTR
jgi:hypothetical protein